jgi:hypothetical protein
VHLARTLVSEGNREVRPCFRLAGLALARVWRTATARHCETSGYLRRVPLRQRGRNQLRLLSPETRRVTPLRRLRLETRKGEIRSSMPWRARVAGGREGLKRAGSRRTEVASGRTRVRAKAAIQCEREISFTARTGHPSRCAGRKIGSARGRLISQKFTLSLSAVMKLYTGYCLTIGTATPAMRRKRR